MSQAEVLEQLRQEIVAAHNPKLAKEPCKTHVYLLFDDGEISMTKAGSLLFQRTMHMQSYGLGQAYPSSCEGLKLPVEFPEKMAAGYGYAFVTREDAARLARRIFEFFGKENLTVSRVEK